MQVNTTRKLSDNSLSWSIFYFVLGATWILSSDLWVYHHGGNLQSTVQSIIKGLAYVLVTSVILYAMMRQNSSATRKLAQKLQKSESRLRRVFDTADEGLIIFDPYYKIEALNSRMATMLIRDSSEMVGVPIEYVFDGDTAFLLRRELDKELTKDCVHVDAGLSRIDGAPCWVHISASRFVEDDQNRYVVLVTDITDHVESEQGVRDVNTELEKRVADRTHILEAVNDELKAFSYSISHDMREPMRAISGYSHMLIEDHKDRLDEDGLHCIERIMAAVSRMNEMIDGMLRLARLTSAELVIEEVSLSKIAQAIGQSLAKSNPNRKIEFDIEPNVFARCDSDLITTVLENLIGNAWKYSQIRDQTKIEFGKEVVEGEVRFFVRDNGIGFPPESTSKIFMPFHRLHRSDDYPGEGIGLATVQRVINKHLGRIWADSEPDKGAVFWFTLGVRELVEA